MTRRSVIFIDAGQSIASAEYLWQIAQKQLSSPEKVYLILTHHHSDHVFGMRVFKDKGVRVIAHQDVKKELENDDGFYTAIERIRLCIRLV